MRLAGETFAQALSQPRLAEPGLARDEHDLPLAVPGASPSAHQQLDLVLAANVGGQAGAVPCLEAALRAPLPDDPPGGLGLGDTLQVLRRQRLTIEKACDQSMGALADNDAPRIGHSL